MKKLALLCALCTPLITANVWADANEKTAPIATPSTTTPHHLTAYIVIAPDNGENARKNWNGAPTKTIDSVHQGSALSALIAFSDCAKNAKGVCDVSAEFFVISPDGVKKSGGSGAVWSGAPLSIPGVLLLGQASLTARFDQTDPVGDYKILADVTDKVSGKVLHLSHNFKVTK